MDGEVNTCLDVSGVAGRTYEDSHLWVCIPHLLHHGGVGGDDLVGPLAAREVVGAQMHRDDVGWIGLQPVDKLLLARDVGGRVAAVALVVLVVARVLAAAGAVGVLGLGADEIDVLVSRIL